MDGAGETHRGHEAEEKTITRNASAPHHRRDVAPGGGSRPTSKLGRLCSGEGSSCCSYSWSPSSLMMFLHACSLVCETPKYRRGREDGRSGRDEGSIL